MNVPTVPDRRDEANAVVKRIDLFLAQIEEEVLCPSREIIEPLSLAHVRPAPYFLMMRATFSKPRFAK
jgi:hypothetical protein